jgi:hypothetical protein
MYIHFESLEAIVSGQRTDMVPTSSKDAMQIGRHECIDLNDTFRAVMIFLTWTILLSIHIENSHGFFISDKALTQQPGCKLLNRRAVLCQRVKYGQ